MTAHEAYEAADRLFKQLMDTGDRNVATMIVRALIRAIGDRKVPAAHHDHAVEAVWMLVGSPCGAAKLDALGLWQNTYPELAPPSRLH